MLIPEEYKLKLKTAAQQIDDAAEALDLDKLKNEACSLEHIRQSPDFYKDQKQAAEVNSKLKAIENLISQLESLTKTKNDLNELMQLLENESDQSLINEFTSESDIFIEQAQSLHLTTLLKGEYDRGNAILSLHAGAGGTEAQDWVAMLFRMYKMYAEKNGFSVEIIDELAGEEAGIKSITFFVNGLNAYGYLKAERGVHRLVRISPFDSNARRHTSFASLEVMPEINNDIDIKINPEDLKIDTYRSGGAGGQHVNKTESAIRITHIPTSIVVTCQNQRSQIQNRETAMKILKGKLIELEERTAQAKVSELKGEVKKIEWGSQIRSYVFQPYTMVKDHRTGFEITDVAAVMNGEIQGFIFDYLKKAG